MDQIWLASPSPALRLWPGSGGATWRLNPAAMAWARSQQLNQTWWRGIAAALSDAHSAGPDREGRLADTPLRWRSLPLNTGWLVWLIPDAAATADVNPSNGVDEGAVMSPGRGVSPAPIPAIAAGGPADGFAHRFDGVADVAGAGLWSLDLATGSADWSRQMFVIHGLAEDAPVPGFEAYAEEIVHPDDRLAFRTALQAAICGEATRFDTDFRIVRPDGSQRWIESRARCDRCGDHDIVAGVALDATDRAASRAETRPERREKEPVERASVGRAEFLARMSHELRTPLNAVLGFAQLVEHDGTSVPLTVQLERVGRIREAGEQLLRLIGDVLEHLERDTPADLPDTVPGGLDDATAGEEPPDRALSVLYIEDNPVNVILVQELVAMRPNTQLRCAITGLAGVALAAVGAPDVVLVDMQLPDIDGFEVLRRLRANRALDRSAVIALSANGMGDDIALALAAGFDDYWTKPIDFRHFLSGLDALAQSR